MGKHLRLIIGVIAVVISGTMYALDFFITRDSQHMLFQIIDDLSFIPLNVFITVVILERLLVRQEKLAILQKLNMVVGAFFSEVGNRMLNTITNSDEKSSEGGQHLAVNSRWTRADFKTAKAFTASLAGKARWSGINLEDLKTFLIQKRPFLLSLLENPNLLEHEQFTDLLWAIFHLDEELEARESLADITPVDRQHLEGDTARVYGLLTAQWLLYTEHLKGNYPYLFSLAVRMNPFLKQQSATVT